MKILLVGATGTLGRQIAKKAIEEGHEVRCFVRNPRKASFLQEWGCELTKGDLLNSSDIEYALQDIEVVIDAATSKPDDPKSIYEIDWDGKVNLFNACESLNVKRVIFLSILLTEKFSEKKAKIFRVSPFLISVTQKVVSFVQDSLNVAERLAFAEVTSSGESLDADMSKTYEILELKKEDMTSLESYIKEYYQQILKRLREMEADLNIEEKKRLPF